MEKRALFHRLPRLSVGTWAGIVTLFLCSCLMVMTRNDYGITWDEPIYFEGARSCAEWFKAIGLKLFGQETLHPLSRETLERVWNPYYHPPLAKTVYAVAWGLLRGIMDDLPAARLGGCVMASLIPSLLVGVLWKRIGPMPAILAGWGFILAPRIFAHSHFISLDIPSALTWLLCVLAFSRILDSKQWVLWSGLTFYLALATKLTAFFLPIPLACWALYFGGRKAIGRCLIAFCMGGILFVAFWPYLWPAPVSNLISYLKLYLDKEQIRTLYMGKIYAIPPPWHYATVMSLVTMPPAMILLFVVGAFSAVKQRRESPIFLLFLWTGLMPILAISLPRALKYDGIRLFMPAFPCLFALSGLGFKTLLDGLFRWRPSLSHNAFKLSGTAMLLLLLGQIDPLWDAHPYQLSYYNCLIGGPKGANRRGFEVTYWGDAFSPQFIQRINVVLPPGSNIKFMPFHPDYADTPPESRNAVFHAINYYAEKGILNPQFEVHGSPPYDFVVLHRRQAFYDDFCVTLERKTQAIDAVVYKGIRLAMVYELKPLPQPAQYLQPFEITEPIPGAFAPHLK